MIILHEIDVEAGGIAKSFLVKTLVKKSASITENFGLDDLDVGYCGIDYVHSRSSKGFRLGAVRRIGNDFASGEIVKISRDITCSEDAFIDNLQQVLAIATFHQGFGECD